MILTYKFRLKDKHAADLRRQARAVNFVWNYCNEVQRKAVDNGRRWLSDPELQRLTSGSSKELGIRSETIGKVCQQYVRSRKRHNRPWLRFRGRKALGWVPFKNVLFDGEGFKFGERRFFPHAP
jgi:putative transposase